MENLNLTEESINKFGRKLDKVGYWDRGNRAEATVIYVKGISNFDDKLEPHKFEETNCLIEVTSYENAVVFKLLLPNAISIAIFTIWREDIVSIEYKDGIEFNIPKFEILKSITPLGPGSGVLGVVISEISINKFVKNKNFKIVGSKVAVGTSVVLHFLNRESNTIDDIYINLPKSYLNFTKDFFVTFWKKALTEEDKKSSKCYIATACFEVNNAPEVLILRNYRDNVLYKSIIGTFLVKFYYLISPTLVKYLYDNKQIKYISKRILILIIKSIDKQNPIV